MECKWRLEKLQGSAPSLGTIDPGQSDSEDLQRKQLRLQY